MNRDALGAQAIGHCGPRRLATEQTGPRPAGVRKEESAPAEAESRRSRATRP